MINLINKKILITGATGGIGYAITKSFVEQGAICVVSGTNEDKLAKLKSEFGDKVVPIKCNLGDFDEVCKLPAQAIDEIAGLDVLVANAGITCDNLAMRMNKDDWDKVININLTSYFALVKSCLRPMMKQRVGRIIGISSIVGVSGNPGQANYCASKAGMIGMTKSVAMEVATRNITANIIAPGFIATEMTNVLNDKQKSAILQKIPMGKMGTAEDIANACLFLASDLAQYITGQTIHVNGGMAMI